MVEYLKFWFAQHVVDWGAIIVLILVASIVSGIGSIWFWVKGKNSKNSS